MGQSAGCPRAPRLVCAVTTRVRRRHTRGQDRDHRRRAHASGPNRRFGAGEVACAVSRASVSPGLRLAFAWCASRVVNRRSCGGEITDRRARSVGSLAMAILCHVAQFRARGLQFRAVVTSRSTTTHRTRRDDSDASINRSDRTRRHVAPLHNARRHSGLLSAVPGKLWRTGPTRSAGSPFRACGRNRHHHRRFRSKTAPPHIASSINRNTPHSTRSFGALPGPRERKALASGAI